jgi:FkbM family methyltransferase
MGEAPDPLVALLNPERLTAVVDVGANPIDGDPPYKDLLAARLCRVVGFEPQPDALAALNARKGDLETYLPYAVADGAPGVLRVCRQPGMTSLLRPDARVVKHFRPFEEWAQVIRELPVETRRLDDIAEIADLDFLKIDAQGSELAVFRHGVHRLQEAVAVQTEVSFVPLYEGQPSFAEIDLELRKLGFIPHCYAAMKKWMIAPLFAEHDPFAAINQLLEADIVYVRDFTQPDRMQPEQLKHLAIVAHHCYRSFDLAVNCLYHLAARGATAPDAVQRYLASIAGR